MKNVTIHENGLNCWKTAEENSPSCIDNKSIDGLLYMR
jgi:hypothetical protein